MNYPFQFMNLGGDECPFIQNVTEILKTDMQSSKKFGCKIYDCHTHAGSKVHFGDFIEAELLFHNSYYNHGFAYLTMQRILEKMPQKANKPTIVLVGYEAFSEIFLQEVQNMLIKKGYNCEYGIYETIAYSDENERRTKPHIRNIYGAEEEVERFIVRYGYSNTIGGLQLCVNDCYFVFIVPINTTLSTLDKMIAKFRNIVPVRLEKMNYDCICLITIGPDPETENRYWHFQDNHHELYPCSTGGANTQFSELSAKKAVYTFAYVESEWQYTTFVKFDSLEKPEFESFDKNKICRYCYPDQYETSQSLTEATTSQREMSEFLAQETPIFDVTRGSVVPMLQLNKHTVLSPLDESATYEKEIQNIRRIWGLSNYVTYRHMYRGDNHFQFYIDAARFLSNDKNVKANETSIDKKMGTMDGVRDFLKELKEKKGICSQTTSKDGATIYNYIVAPRHETDSKWVNLVNEVVFNDSLARVLYFDITKEYRSNLKAKYSDIIHSLRNIHNSEQAYEVHFHYVDETITSGSNFLRAADLIRSLVSEIDNEDTAYITEKRSANDRLGPFHLFESIILLYGRASFDSQIFYSNIFKDILPKEMRKSRVYTYADIRISSMRNHEDACTLCKLSNDHMKVRRQCATNELARINTNFIKKHEAQEIVFEDIIDSKKGKKSSKNENESIFAITTEKRYLFLISHILNYCLESGRIFYFKDSPPLDTTSSNAADSICDFLEIYYQYLYSWIFDENGEIKSEIKGGLNKRFNKTRRKKNDKELDFQCAFIKTISRPFFTFNLRYRQAAFKFCLKKIDSLLSNDDKTPNTLILTQVLVKALSDMNANYIIRGGDETAPFNKLFNLAKVGNSEKKPVSEKQLFNQLQFSAQIKQMMSLTQDTTKSLLLESLMIYDTEKYFFNALDNKIDVQLGNDDYYRALMYFENNRIIHDALQSIRNSTNDIKSVYYYLDNFKQLLRLNRLELCDDQLNKPAETIHDNVKVVTLGKFKKIYGKVRDCLRGEKKFGELDEKLTEWMELICDSISIVSFVCDRENQKAMDSNHLFMYFKLADETSTDDKNSKRFYHDKHIEYLYEELGIGKKKELDGGSFNIVFNKDNISPMSGDAKECKYHYAWIKFSDTDIDKDKDQNESKDSCDYADSVYLEIRIPATENQSEKLRFFFVLKMLMSLRSDFIFFMRNNKLPVLIQSKSQEMKRRAMDISKSITHSSANIFMSNIFATKCNIQNVSYWDTYEKTLRDQLKTESDKEGRAWETFGIPYFKYYHVIANEFVSSLYRKTVRDDISEEPALHSYSLENNVANCFFGYCENKSEDYNGARSVLHPSTLSNELGKLFKTEKLSRESATIMGLGFTSCVADSGKKAESVASVRIQFTADYKDDPPINILQNTGFHCSFYPELLLFWVMLMNVVAHGDKTKNNIKVTTNQEKNGNNKILDFYIDDTTMVFSNKSNGETMNQDYINIPPWCFDRENQHITLWTLKHYLGKNNVTIENKNKKFSITITYQK